MGRHFHIEKPFLCIEGTGWGWSVAPECTPERVEPCSEVVLSGGVLAPNVEALFSELRKRHVEEADIEHMRRQVLGKSA